MCAIDYADDAFSVYRTKDGVTARKEHKCDECSRVIAKGEKYFYAFGVYDGSGSAYHMCAHCKIAADWLSKNCGGFLHCGVSEDIGEHIEEYRDLRPGLMRFKIGMRRKWKRFDGAGLMPVPRQAAGISVAERH